MLALFQVSLFPTCTLLLWIIHGTFVLYSADMIANDTITAPHANKHGFPQVEELKSKLHESQELQQSNQQMIQ